MSVQGRTHLCVCVCEREREREREFPSQATEVARQIDSNF